MASLDPIIAALDNAGKKHRRLGAGIIAQCPSHPDRSPSLAITPKDDKIVLHCFAGCQPDQILTDLDLTWAQLFDEPLPSISNITDLTPYLLNVTATDATTTPPTSADLYPIEYIYTDSDGNPVGKKVRLTDSDGKKTFRQYRYDNGQWLPGLNGIDLPLYNAYFIEVAKAAGEHVWIVEGEKDAETLTLLDHIATTMPNGAGSWNQRHTDQLNGITHINIIADNDEPGLKHAAQVTSALTDAGITHRLYLPAAGKDITDHIDAGLTIDELIDAETQLQTIKDQQWQKQLQRLKDEELLRQTARNEIRREIAEREHANRYALPAHTRNLTDELAKPDEEATYIIDQLWPTGANISLTATYKAGKTSTINNIVKSLADGIPLFGQFDTNHTGRIAIWNYEVSANQIRRWIRDVDIRNTDDISILNMRGHTWPITSAYVTDHTIAWLRDNNIRTWIIDPLARAFVGSGDENDNSAVGIFLDTLDYIKDQAGVDNLLIAAHTGRNAEQGNNRARGASRFDDWVDARWMLTKDADGQRWFTADGRDVYIDESQLDYDDTSRTQTIQMNKNQREAKRGKKVDHILQTLAKHPGGLNKSELERAVKAEHGSGYGISKAEQSPENPLRSMLTNGQIVKSERGIYSIANYSL